jgi:hypothetical protein
MLIECIAGGIPFPAFETFDSKQLLPRRFFLFFDTFFRAGRHNKELWTAAIETDDDPETRFGTCLIEAHVITTVRENYFRWIFQILSDKRVTEKDEDISKFKTEYDVDADSMPNPCDLVCSKYVLKKECEICYDEETNSFKILEADTPTEYKAAQDKQSKELLTILQECSGNHRDTLEWMRTEVKRLRENRDNFNQEEMKKAQSAAKKRLKQFVDLERPTKKKKSKSGNKGRCSTTKVNFFGNQKLRLDDEEKTGLRRSWELVYKQVMNELEKDDDDGEEGTNNQVLSSHEWVNELNFHQV